MKKESGFGTVAIVGIVALVLIVGGVLVGTNDKEEKTTTNTDAVMEGKENDSMMEESHDDSMMEGEAMEEKGDGVMMEGDIKVEAEVMMEKSAGTYVDYSASALASAEGKKLLFFHATWCPSCRALNSDISGNLSEIPAGVTIFKTDYDKETELKKKYGVTLQHTIVQVDAEGNMIAKWSGSADLAGVIAKIK